MIKQKGKQVILLLELLFPLLFFVMVGYFIWRWNRAVKAGIFQKGQLTETIFRKKNQ